MPEVITGLSLLLLFVAIGFERGFWTITLAHITFTMCFVAVVVQSRLVTFDRALEEAALPYRVESTPFRDRGPEHFAHQPFGQVPWLTDGALSIFESGAILLHLAEKSPALMPTDPRGRAEVVEWVIAALNSVDVPSQPWALFRFMGLPGEGPEAKFVEDYLTA
eukprot:gene16888-20642_t